MTSADLGGRGSAPCPFPSHFFFACLLPTHRARAIAPPARSAYAAAGACYHGCEVHGAMPSGHALAADV